MSAVRNLQEVMVSGRNLRVELSTDQPEGGGGGRMRGGREGGGGGRGEGGMGRGVQGQGGFTPPTSGGGGGRAGYGPRASGGFGEQNMPGGGGGGAQQSINGGPNNAGIKMELLPSGQNLPPGQSAADVISKTLSSIPPGKMEEVMLGMKVSPSVFLLTSYYIRLLSDVKSGRIRPV